MQPNRFPLARIAAAVAVMTVFSLLWNTVVHGLVLQNLNAALEGIARPAAQRSLAVGLLLTVGIASLFVVSLARSGRLAADRKLAWRSGWGHGVFFALLAGLLVDLNQYLIYPIPATVPWAWFAAGLLEFSLAGVLVAGVLGALPNEGSKA